MPNGLRKTRPARSQTRWLPHGKTAALCLSIDDVHPARSAQGYDAGGDLGAGVLGYVERLLMRHPCLRITLFVTPDWQPKELVAGDWRARVPLLAEHIYQIDRHTDGRYRLDRHPELVRHLTALPRCEIAPHGLHHVHRGSRFAVEFQNEGRPECRRRLRDSMAIFEAAALGYVRGFAPPGWSSPPALIQALADLDFTFLSSARDLDTPIGRDAVTNASGMRGVALTQPQSLCAGRLQHIPVNFQFTSPAQRAHEIVACNGLVSIKAHAFKHAGGHTMADGLDSAYFEYLDRVLGDLEERHGDSLWWASMSEIAAAANVAPPQLP